MDRENENGQLRTPPMELADEAKIVGSHDFGDDHVRAHSFEGSESSPHSARRATDLQIGTRVDPLGDRTSHQSVPFHEKDLLTLASPVTLWLLAHQRTD